MILVALIKAFQNHIGFAIKYHPSKWQGMAADVAAARPRQPARPTGWAAVPKGLERRNSSFAGFVDRVKAQSRTHTIVSAMLRRCAAMFGSGERLETRISGDVEVEHQNGVAVG